MTQTALILGGTGRFGRATAEAFWNAGWKVRLFDRKTDDISQVARGVDVIVNGWNPKYDRWAAELPGLAETVIEAARISNATVIQPANIYVYGAGSPERISAETPHAAQNPLGRLRIDMEDALHASGVQVILLRAGDYIDTEASGNWLDQIVLGKLSKGRVVYPGNPDIPHAWAYLPDLARAALRLAERRADLGQFTDVLFPGYTLTGREIAAQLSRALGRPIQLGRMSWLPLHLARPVWPMARGLLEMRYLWNMPHRLENPDLVTLTGAMTETPAEMALHKAALAVLGEEDVPISLARSEPSAA